MSIPVDLARLQETLADHGAGYLLTSSPEDRGYTLLVDGTATADDDGIAVTPESAVLHRPADHADGPPAGDGCGNDCAPVE